MRHWRAIVGRAGCLLAAVGLVWLGVSVSSALQTSRLLVARTQAEVGLHEMEMAVVFMDRDAQWLTLGIEGQRRLSWETLSSHLESLMRGAHKVGVAVRTLPAGWWPASAWERARDAAREMEDSARALASMAGGDPHRLEVSLKVFQDTVQQTLRLLSSLRQNLPEPPQPSMALPALLAGVGVVLGGVGWLVRPRTSAPLPPPETPDVRTLVHALPVPAVVVDADGIVQWGNAGAAALLGLGQSVPSGFRLAEVVADEAASQGSFLSREMALYRSDGSVVWVVRSSAPLPWREQHHILHLLWDITERRQREAVCQAEAARWRGIFDAFDVGILVADGLAVVDANPAWVRLTGLPRPVAGEPVAKALPWSLDVGDGPQLKLVDGRALLVSRFPCPEGSTCQVYRLVDARLAWKQGLSEGRKLVLRVGQMVLERIGAMLSALDGRSHGLRMQVESLQAFVRLRLEEGEAPQLFALEREVRGLVEKIRGLGQAWGVAVHTALGPLPSLVRAPRWTLMQAITQTLWGACFRSQGSRCIWGIEAPDTGSGKVRLKVMVHMPGTAPRWPIQEDELVEADLLDQDNLFFTVAALAVYRLGGSPLETRPQVRGVEISWSVPLEVGVAGAPAGDAPQDAPQTSGELAAISSGPSQPLRVVVAEDNPFNAALLEGILVELGAGRVAVVEDGEKLVELLEATPDAFDVLLVDVEMPQKNGVEAVRYLRSQGLRLPVIGLTAHGDEAIQQQCVEAGMDAVLTKPYQPQEIAAVLRRWHWIP